MTYHQDRKAVGQTRTGRQRTKHFGRLLILGMLTSLPISSGCDSREANELVGEWLDVQARTLSIYKADGTSTHGNVAPGEPGAVRDLMAGTPIEWSIPEAGVLEQQMPFLGKVRATYKISENGLRLETSTKNPLSGALQERIFYRHTPEGKALLQQRIESAKAERAATQETINACLATCKEKFPGAYGHAATREAGEAMDACTRACGTNTVTVKY